MSETTSLHQEAMEIARASHEARQRKNSLQNIGLKKVQSMGVGLGINRRNSHVMPSDADALVSDALIDEDAADGGMGHSTNAECPSAQRRSSVPAALSRNKPAQGFRCRHGSCPGNEFLRSTGSFRGRLGSNAGPEHLRHSTPAPRLSRAKSMGAVQVTPVEPDPEAANDAAAETVTDASVDLP